MFLHQNPTFFMVKVSEKNGFSSWFHRGTALFSFLFSQRSIYPVLRQEVFLFSGLVKGFLCRHSISIFCPQCVGQKRRFHKKYECPADLQFCRTFVTISYFVLFYCVVFCHRLCAVQYYFPAALRYALNSR